MVLERDSVRGTEEYSNDAQQKVVSRQGKGEWREAQVNVLCRQAARYSQHLSALNCACESVTLNEIEGHTQTIIRHGSITPGIWRGLVLEVDSRRVCARNVPSFDGSRRDEFVRMPLFAIEMAV